MKVLLAWEGLSPGRQAAIALPLLIAFFFFLHKVLFGVTTGLSIVYGVLYGAVLTFALVAATRNERAKRKRREQGK
jgi:uncharacterized membrane protein